VTRQVPVLGQNRTEIPAKPPYSNNNIHLISSLKRKELSHYQFVTNAGVGGQR